MNRALLAGIILLVVMLIAFGGIGIWNSIFRPPSDGEQLQRRIEELKKENADLKHQREKDIVEIRELNARVEALSDSQPGGMVIEEKRKALAMKEGELNSRETRLVQREEQLRLDQKKLDDEERKFLDKLGLKVEQIGEARQIQANHEQFMADKKRMEDRLEQAEERANSWLKAIYAISILFFVGVIALIAFLMHMAAKNRRVDMAMRTVESVNLSAHDRNLLMASLGGRIIEQPRDDEDEQ